MRSRGVDMVGAGAAEGMGGRLYDGNLYGWTGFGKQTWVFRRRDNPRFAVGGEGLIYCLRSDARSGVRSIRLPAMSLMAEGRRGSPVSAAMPGRQVVLAGHRVNITAAAQGFRGGSGPTCPRYRSRADR